MVAVGGINLARREGLALVLFVGRKPVAAELTLVIGQLVPHVPDCRGAAVRQGRAGRCDIDRDGGYQLSFVIDFTYLRRRGQRLWRRERLGAQVRPGGCELRGDSARV